MNQDPPCRFSILVLQIRNNNNKHYIQLLRKADRQTTHTRIRYILAVSDQSPMLNKQTKIPMHIQMETISPATRLLQKRRRMYEVHEAFEAQKEEYKKDQQKFKKIEQQIRKRDLEIQVQLVDFCQFLQENESKRKKAEDRTKAEEKAFKEKETEIDTVEKQISELAENQMKIEARVSLLRKYEEYLEKVRSTYNDQFPEIVDILNRHATLKKFNFDLSNERKQNQIILEELKVESANYEKDMNQSILQLSNEIKDLSRKLESKINERNELQLDVEHTNEQSSKKNLNLGKILMAIDNLYVKCGEGSTRINHRWEQYLQNPQEKKNNKKKQDKKQENKEDQHQQEEDTYETKTRIASLKLKCIFSYMKDFKTVIDEYKKEKASQTIKK